MSTVSDAPDTKTGAQRRQKSSPRRVDKVPLALALQSPKTTALQDALNEQKRTAVLDAVKAGLFEVAALNLKSVLKKGRRS